VSLLEWVDIIRALTVPVLFLIAVLGFFILFFTGRFRRIKIGPIDLDTDQEASRIRARLESIEGDDKSAKQYVLLQEYHAQG
jgi:hypothetical protein